MPGSTEGNRHRDVLECAMKLIAERGLEAASLRELARRVGLSQPSLYHYFRAKEDLVEQIIETFAREVLKVPEEPPPMADLREFLRTVLDRVLDLYRVPQNATFARFCFTIAMVRPTFGASLRRVLLGQGVTLALPFAREFVERGDVLAEDVRPMLRTVLDAVAMRCIEHLVLLRGEQPSSFDLGGYADFVADVVARGVQDRARAAQQGAEPADGDGESR